MRNRRILRSGRDSNPDASPIQSPKAGVIMRPCRADEVQHGQNIKVTRNKVAYEGRVVSISRSAGWIQFALQVTGKLGQRVGVRFDEIVEVQA